MPPYVVIEAGWVSSSVIFCLFIQERVHQNSAKLSVLNKSNLALRTHPSHSSGLQTWWEVAGGCLPTTPPSYHSAALQWPPRGAGTVFPIKAPTLLSNSNSTPALNPWGVSSRCLSQDPSTSKVVMMSCTILWSHQGD